MSDSTELDAILADLVTGAIGTAEASRRIKALVPAASDHTRAETTAYDHTQTSEHEPQTAATKDDSSVGPQRAPGPNAASDARPTAEPFSAPFSDEAAGSHTDGPTTQGPDSASESVTAESPTRGASAHQSSTSESSAYESSTFGAPSNTSAHDGERARNSSEYENSSRGAARESSAQQASTRADEPAGSHGIAAVQVRVTGRRVRVIGDDTIATVAVSGPHSLRRRGDRLEVISEDEPNATSRGFILGKIPRSGEDLRRLGLGEALTVRVNPAIETSVELTGGSLNSVGVPYFDTVRVTGGLTDLRDITRVSDMLVQAGGASLHGDFRGGRSRVRVETGNLNVALTPTANVTITASARLGGVSWPDGGAKLDEFVAGNGAGRLELNAFVGRIAVRQDGSTTPGATDSFREDAENQATNEKDTNDKQWWEIWRH